MKRILLSIAVIFTSLLFLPPHTFADIKIPSSITWEKAATLTIDNIPLPANFSKYHITLTNTNGSKGWTRDFQLQVNQNRSCNLTSYGDDDKKALAKSDPTCSVSTDATPLVSISFGITPSLANKYLFPKNVIDRKNPFSRQDTYALSFKDDDPSGTTPATDLTKSFFILGTVSSPELSIEPTHIRSGQDVTLTAQGCPIGSEVTFHLDNKEGEKGDKRATVDDAGTATVKLTEDKYTLARRNTIFEVAAACTAGIPSTVKKYYINENGYETTEIVPSHPEPEENFTVNVYGLETDGQCYFFKIKNLDTGEWLDPAGDRATLYDGSCADGKMDSGRRVGVPGLPGSHTTIDHKAEFYAIFQGDAPSKSFEIPGQLDGAYEFQLWTPDRADTFGGANANEDDAHESGWLKFVVGDGQIPEDPKAPPPPCAKGIKYDFSVENGAVGSQTDTQANVDLCTEYVSALGPIPTEATAFVGKFFAILLSISGGIILAMLIYSGYQIIMSQGNPDKIKEARERITSTIVGILFLVLSVIILQVIGVDILHLPGLSR